MAAGDNTQRTWRQEDLHELQEGQENCLADELQSGLYLSEFSSDSMKEIIQSIMTDEGMSTPFYSAEQTGANSDLHTSFTDIFKNNPSQTSSTTPLNSPSQTRYVSTADRDFCCILKLPTACTQKTEDTTVTYLNRGQIYYLTLSSTNKQVHQVHQCVSVVTLSVEFHDLRLRNYESAHLSDWMQLNQGERLITIENKSCANIFDIKYVDGIQKVDFSWNPLHEAVVAFSVNCLSSEFTQKKHGGERGVLLRLVVNTSGGEMTTCVHRHYCLVKVFKDKGADRKHKQDLQKREKLPPDEADRYWKSKPYTLFEPLPLSSPVTQTCNDEPSTSSLGEYNPTMFSLETLSTSSPNPNNVLSPQATPTMSQVLTPPQLHPTSPIATPTSHSLTSYTNIDETKQWLLSNRFGPYVSLFCNYSGSDFLRLSRKDLMDICGPADGIRLFNALHSHPLKRVYICLENESVYQGIFLEAMTASHFKDMVSSKLSVPSSSIVSVLMQLAPSILINIDDLCVENMFDEQCFIVQAIKEEESSTYQLILKPLADTTPYISAQGMIPRGLN